MVDFIFHATAYMAQITLVVSVLIGAIYYKKLPALIQLLWCFLVWNLLIEIGAKIMSRLWTGNNLPLLHLYTVGEFLFFAFFYKKIFFKANEKNHFFLLFIAIMTSLIIGNTVFVQSIYGFNSYAKTLVHLFIIGCVVKYFLMFLSQNIAKEFTSTAIQLINVAILIYYAGSLFIFMFSNTLLNSESVIHLKLFSINAILNLLFQSIILFAIWKTIYSKQTKYSY